MDLTPLDPSAGRLSPSRPKLDGRQDAFVAWLFARGGLDAAAYRSETIERRFPACLRICGTNDLDRARRVLEDDDALFHRALGSLVIGVSSFFRDASVFQHIGELIVPSLPPKPRIWSIGCSEGQELYSIAMLLTDANRLAGATLLGTDCRAHAIARARLGAYETRSVSDVTEDRLTRHFIREPVVCHIGEHLRRAVEWRVADITRIHEPGGWDVILCRNALMYLRSDWASNVWRACEASLRTGGFLVLGRAERPSGASRLVPVWPCIYRKE